MRPQRDYVCCHSLWQGVPRAVYCHRFRAGYVLSGHCEETMDYRAYMVTGDGHIISVREVMPDAPAKAKRCVDGHDVEIWQRDRLVTGLSHKDTQ